MFCFINIAQLYALRKGVCIHLKIHSCDGHYRSTILPLFSGLLRLNLPSLYTSVIYPGFIVPYRHDKTILPSLSICKLA